MLQYNKVDIAGNLVADIELRYTNDGTPVGTLRLAANEKFKRQDGTVKESVTWINCVLWGKTAENCNQYRKKGDPVLVEGKLQSRNWEDKEGNKRSTIEIVAHKVHFLNSKPKEDQAQESVGLNMEV